MSWLRIDDGFASHPKIAALTDKQLRVWLRVLCYCAKRDSAQVDDVTIQEVPGVTKQVVHRFAELALLDENGGVYEVHDWLLYTSNSIESKVDWYLEKHPEATANEVVRQIGGTRQIVLDAVKRWFDTGSATGSDRTSEPGSDRTGLGGSESGSESGSRACAARPVLKDVNPKAVSEGTNGTRAHEPKLTPLEAAGDPDADIDFNSPAIPRRTA